MQNEVLTGSLRKMVSELQGNVAYQLPVGDQLLPMNELIGRKITPGISGRNSLLSLWA